MTEAPDIFVAAAQWLSARPLGCSAAGTLTRTLVELTGPPRFGVLRLTSSGMPEAPRPGNPRPRPDDPGARVDAEPAVKRGKAGGTVSAVSWPIACGAAVDVVIVEHPGALAGPVRARMADGPQVFIHSRSPAQTARWFRDGIAESELVAARSVMLAGELRALAFGLERDSARDRSRDQSSVLAEQLRAIAELGTREACVAQNLTTCGVRDPDSRVMTHGGARGDGHARFQTTDQRAAGGVAVFGPDPSACEQVARTLRGAGIRLRTPVESPGYLVAVAPAAGWEEADADVVWATAGRAPGAGLITTARLPGTGACGKPPDPAASQDVSRTEPAPDSGYHPEAAGPDGGAASATVVPPDELAAWLGGCPPPTPSAAAWRHAALIVRQRRTALVNERLRVALANPDAAVANRLIDELAAELGLEKPADPSPATRAERGSILAPAALTGIGVTLAAGRYVGGVGAASAGMWMAVLVASMRWRSHARHCARRSASLKAAELKARVTAQIPDGAAGGGLRWLTRRGSGVIDRQLRAPGADRA